MRNIAYVLAKERERETTKREEEKGALETEKKRKEKTTEDEISAPLA